MEVFNLNGFRVAMFKVQDDAVHVTVIPTETKEFPTQEFESDIEINEKINAFAFKNIRKYAMQITDAVIRQPLENSRQILIKIMK